jgi:Putative adhesin
VDFKKSGQNGDLTIRGGPRNDFEIRIQVPRQTHLEVRMPFGDLEVARVIGNKDVEVHAGDVTLELGDAKQYSHVDASVTSGDLSAKPFNVEKGGLFRSFTTQGAGIYKVHAHVGAGDLTLKD